MPNNLYSLPPPRGTGLARKSSFEDLVRRLRASFAAASSSPSSQPLRDPSFGRVLRWKPRFSLFVLLGLIATILVPVVLLLRSRRADGEPLWTWGGKAAKIEKQRLLLTEELNAERAKQNYPALTAGDLPIGGSDYVPACCSSLIGGNCYFGFSDDKTLSGAMKRVARKDGKKLKIGFITFATGPYNDFLPELWESIKKHAFRNQETHLFVFTDKALDSTFLSEKGVGGKGAERRIHKKFISRLGWPFDSSARHFLYLRSLSFFSEMDYVFSIDSDMAFVGDWDERALGERVAAFQAWPFGHSREDFKYDSRLTLSGAPYSAAYIGPGEGSCYYAGGLFGGTVEGFAAILRATTEMTRDDLRKSPPRTALWHDESVLNRYFASNPPTLILGPHFVYPEAPADSWLYFPSNPSREVWLRMRLLREAAPRLLNLGVRKHLKASVETFQPPTSLIPAVMSLSGKPELFVTPATPESMAPRVTFIVKAFERRSCVIRLLDSIAGQYPHVPTLVLDDSKEPLLSDEEQAVYQKKIPALRFLRTGYDVGLAAGRNILVDAVETPYVLLLDDDFILNEQSHIEKLVDALEWGRFDLAGGCIDSAYSYLALRSPGKLEIKPDVPCFGPASRQPDYEADGLSCFQTDFINNFFLGRVSALKEVKWDPRLKLGEHEDFYLRVQDKGLRVGVCRGATAVNDNSCDANPSYKKQRGRVFDFWVLVFKKWGIDTMKTAAGEYHLKCPATAEERAAAEAKEAEDKENAIPGLEGCSIDVNQESIWFSSK